MLNVADLIAAARRRVLDTHQPYRYEDAFYIDGLNQAISTMVEFPLDSFGRELFITLQEGTNQRLHFPAVRFLRVLGGISRTTREMLDVTHPGWEDEAPDPTRSKPIHWGQNDESKDRFFVYPAVPSCCTIRVLAAVHPGIVAAPTGMIDVSPEYHMAIVNYIAAFVLSSDDEDPHTTAKAQQFMTQFFALVGGNLRAPTTEANNAGQ